MSIHLNFDTGSLSSEEADGLTALLGAVRPSLPTAKELAKRYDQPNGLYGSTALSGSVGYGSGVQTPAGQAELEMIREYDERNRTDGVETPREPTATAPKRERGQPSPGKARRTKAEIAEDEAADAADGKAAAEQTEAVGNAVSELSGQADATATHMTPDKDDPVVARNAETAEDDAETQAQDAADEQAEVDAARDPENPLTVEDLKQAYLPYFEKYGMEATKEDGAKMFVEIFGPVPEGSNGWTTAAMVEQGQDKVRQAIDGWARMAAENPHGRKAMK